MPAWARARFFLGAGSFQVSDGTVDHNLLRVHQGRYGVELLPCDLAWSAFGAALLLIGLALLVRARTVSPRGAG